MLSWVYMDSLLNKASFRASLHSLAGHLAELSQIACDYLMLDGQVWVMEPTRKV